MGNSIAPKHHRCNDRRDVGLVCTESQEMLDVRAQNGPLFAQLRHDGLDPFADQSVTVYAPAEAVLQHGSPHHAINPGHQSHRQTK
jgi:hypothetical protein